MLHQANDVLNCGRLTLPGLSVGGLEPLLLVRPRHVEGECVPLVDCLEVAVVVEGVDYLADPVCKGCRTELERVDGILGKVYDGSVSGHHPVFVFARIIDNHHRDFLQVMATCQESLDEGRLSGPAGSHGAPVGIAVRVEVQADGHSPVGSSNVDPAQYLLDRREFRPGQRDEVCNVERQDPERLGRNDYAGSTKKLGDCPVHVIAPESLCLDSQRRLKGGDQRLCIGLQL